MEKTLNVGGLPEERIQYLKDLIALWKKHGAGEKTPGAPKPIIKRKVDPSEFLVVKSRVIGGEVTRAMVYDE